MSAEAVGNCRRCQRGYSGPFCACGTIQDIPEGIDLFTVLGLPKTMHLSAGLLDRHYLERTRLLHPDRFVLLPELDQAYATRWSTALNRAVKTLRSVHERIDYVLSSSGFSSSPSDTKRMPLDLAELYFEAQEASDATSIAALLAQAIERDAKLDDSLRDLTEKWDGEGEAAHRTLAPQIREILNTKRYLASMIADMQKRV